MDKPIESKDSPGDEGEETANPKRLKMDHSEEEPTTPTTGPFLWDLSDDVLLIILSFLPQIDMMMLGRTCSRFDALILDRTLWVDVDCRGSALDEPTYRQALSNLLPTTQSLALDLSRVSASTTVTDENSNLSEVAVRRARECAALTSLTLENARIDACRLQILHFPARLTYWSLKGSTVEDLPFERSYFMNLHFHMPNLQTLVLSECPWFQAHSLMAIAKCPLLRELRLDGCIHLGNCMAYCSMSARFAFKSLETLDVRRTRLSDAEIGCFNRVTTLKHLLVESMSESESLELAQNVAQGSMTCHVLPSRCMIVLDRVNNEYIVNRQVVLRPDIHEDEINHIIRNVDSMDRPLSRRFIDQGRACVEGAGPFRVAVRARNTPKICIDVDTFGNRRVGQAGCSRDGDDGAGPSRQPAEAKPDAGQRREDTVQRQVWRNADDNDAYEDAIMEENAEIAESNARRENVAHFAVENGPFKPTNFTGPDFVVNYTPPESPRLSPRPAGNAVPDPRQRWPTEADFQKDILGDIEKVPEDFFDFGEPSGSRNAARAEPRETGNDAVAGPGSPNRDAAGPVAGARARPGAAENDCSVRCSGPHCVINVNLGRPSGVVNRASQTDGQAAQTNGEPARETHSLPRPERPSARDPAPNFPSVSQSTQTDNLAAKRAADPQDAEDSSSSDTDEGDSGVVGDARWKRRVIRPMRQQTRQILRAMERSNLVSKLRRAEVDQLQQEADRRNGLQQQAEWYARVFPASAPICIDDNAVTLGLGRVADGGDGSDSGGDSKSKRGEATSRGADDDLAANRAAFVPTSGSQKADTDGNDDRNAPAGNAADPSNDNTKEAPQLGPESLRHPNVKPEPPGAADDVPDPVIVTDASAITVSTFRTAKPLKTANDAAVSRELMNEVWGSRELSSQHRAAEDALDRLGAKWEAQSSSDEEDNAELVRLQTLLRCAKKNGEVAGDGIQLKDAAGPAAKAELGGACAETERVARADVNVGQDGAGPSNAGQPDNAAPQPALRRVQGFLVQRFPGPSSAPVKPPMQEHFAARPMFRARAGPRLPRCLPLGLSFAEELAWLGEVGRPGRHLGGGGGCVRFLVPPATQLITDAAIQDLFVGDVDWPYMVRIAVEPSTPSRLETLVLRGYPGITDRSLRVLAAVPTLRALDVTGTGVTAAGIATFRDLRPEVALKSSFD